MDNEKKFDGANEEESAEGEIGESELADVSDAAPLEVISDKSKKRRGTPIWVTVICVFFAALITFQTTYVILTDKYNTELNRLASQGAVTSDDTSVKFDSAVSPSLAKMYKLIDEAAALFEKYYIYEVDYDALLEKMMYEYAVSTGDKYAYYYTAEKWKKSVETSTGNSVGLGVYVRRNGDVGGELFITYVMTGSPAESAGLRAGDVVVSVDGQKLADVEYEEAVSLCGGEVGTNVTLTVNRDGEDIEIVATRNNYSVETVLSKMIEKDGHKIGYVRIIQFYTVTVSQFKGAVRELISDGCEGIVFDVRSNPGGELSSIIGILDYLLPSGPIVRITNVEGNEQIYSSDEKCISDMPMTVLVNGDTASAAELFTSALADYDYATVVGTKTYGKGCGQSIVALSNGGRLSFTTFLYSPPYSDNYDGVGIYPDVEVDLDKELSQKSIFVISEDEDNQLAVALEEILKKIN